MTLVETNGLVLFGPGSEWLWSLISNVVLVVTLVGVYVQLRADRATRAFDQTMAIRAEWASTAERHTRLVALIDLEDRTPEEGLPGSAYGPAGWFDRLGGLLHNGHVHLDQLAAIVGGDAIWWWATCKPYVECERRQWGAPQHLRGFEYLATEMAKRFRSEGFDIGGLPFTRPIAVEIEGYTALLQRQADIERGVIPQRRTAMVAPSAPEASEASS